jgi:hypothetical protein
MTLHNSECYGRCYRVCYGDSGVTALLRSLLPILLHVLHRFRVGKGGENGHCESASQGVLELAPLISRSCCVDPNRNEGRR